MSLVYHVLAHQVVQRLWPQVGQEPGTESVKPYETHSFHGF